MGEDDDEPEIELGSNEDGTPLDVSCVPVIVTVGQVGVTTFDVPHYATGAARRARRGG